MHKKLRQEILKELRFLQNQNKSALQEEKLFEEIAEGLNSFLLNEIESIPALQLAAERWLRAKAAGNTGQLRAAERLLMSNKKGADIVNKLKEITVADLKATKNFDQVANGIVAKAKPGAVLTATPSAPPPPGKAPIPSSATRLTAGSIIKTKAKDVAELAKNLGKTEKEVQALINQKAITFNPGKSYLVNSVEDATAMLKSASTSTAAASGEAAVAANVAKTTAAEVSAAAKNPAKFVQLLERIRKGAGSLPVKAFIEKLGKIAKPLAVIGAAMYAWQLATDPSAITFDEHLLGGATVVEVGAMLAAKAGFASIAGAASAVGGGVAIGTLIGMGINKLGSMAAEAQKNEEKGEVVNAKGQQAVEMFKQYCKGGFKRGESADSTLGAIGKGIAGTVGNIATLGQYSKLQASKGEQTPMSWGREDVDDMAILYNTIINDKSINDDTKKELSKCFAPLYGTKAGNVLQARGLMLGESGILTAEEVANLLNSITPEPSQTSPAAAGDAQPATAPGTFDQRTHSFKCSDTNTIMNFQKWVKANAQTPQAKAIKVDGAFGPKTFAAAKSLGNEVLNFGMYNSIDDFKDPAKLNKVCSDLAADSRFKSVAAQPAAKAPAKRDYESFYENKKVKNAEMLFEKLIKSSAKKEIL